MTTSHDKQFRWVVVAMVGGFVLLWVARAYFAFVFLPRHHGSFGEAAGRLIDFGPWLAFVRSGPGLVLHLAAMTCFVAVVVLLFCRRPPRGRGDR